MPGREKSQPSVWEAVGARGRSRFSAEAARQAEPNRAWARLLWRGGAEAADGSFESSLIILKVSGRCGSADKISSASEDSRPPVGHRIGVEL